MSKINGKYDDVMEFVFKLKDKAYEKTKGMNFKTYLKYIRKDIQEMEELLEKQKEVKCYSK